MALFLKNQLAIRLLDCVRPYRYRVAVAVLGMLGTALTEPMFPAVMKPLLDRGFTGKPSFHLWMVPVVIMGIFVLRGICTFTTSYILSWISNKLLSDLRGSMFQRILDVPVDFYHTQSGGQILNTIMFEVQQIVEMVKVSINTLIRDSLTVLALLLFLLYLNWQLTIVALALIPLMAILIRTVSKRLRTLNQQQLAVNAELTQVIEEATRGHQVVRLFGAQEYEARHFAEKSEKLRGYARRTTIAAASTVPLTQWMASCAVAVVIMIALVQSGQNQTTVGGFVSFITAMLMLLTPLKHLADLNGPLQRGLVAAESVFALIDVKPEQDVGTTHVSRARGALEFKGVGLTYSGQTQPALRDIHLNIPAGETLALVGMSGGGKTSLAHLVPRFYAPTTGEIFLDGESLSTLSLPSLRAQIAMVSQNVVLFDDTLEANIAYGDSHLDPIRVREAAQAAHLMDVIADLPLGLQTLVGDNGMRLSGGQRQRLAIARAIYKDAPILILDEATSSLDSESERAVQEALDHLMQGRTTLVIAHRLSTIERADRIAVLVDGSIVELGSHTELLAKNGVYTHLYQLQFSRKT